MHDIARASSDQAVSQRSSIGSRRNTAVEPLADAPKPPSPYEDLAKNQTQILLESAKQSNKKVLAPIPRVPLPKADDSSDDEPPSYLDIALQNHDRAKQTFADRNRAAQANPVPSALVPVPRQNLRQNASAKLVPLDDPAQARLASVPNSNGKASVRSLANNDVSAGASAAGDNGDGSGQKYGLPGASQIAASASAVQVSLDSGDMLAKARVRRVVKKKKKKKAEPAAADEQDSNEPVIHGLSDARQAKAQ